MVSGINYIQSWKRAAKESLDLPMVDPLPWIAWRGIDLGAAPFLVEPVASAEPAAPAAAVMRALGLLNAMDRSIVEASLLRVAEGEERAALETLFAILGFRRR